MEVMELCRPWQLGSLVVPCPWRWTSFLSAQLRPVADRLTSCPQDPYLCHLKEQLAKPDQALGHVIHLEGSDMLYNAFGTQTVVVTAERPEGWSVCCIWLGICSFT